MIRIQVDTVAVRRQLGALQAEMPTVCRNALNDTAFGLKKHLTEVIKAKFPTAHPSTVKNISVMKATKEAPVAKVFFDQLYRKGIDEYMLPLIEGGGRAMKPSEKRLGQYWIPAYKSNPGMLNKYGNVPGGKVQQILSRLGQFNTSGFNMNETAGSKARRTGGGKSTEYFMIKSRRGGLAPGVYQRTEKRNGFTSTAAPRAQKHKVGAFQPSNKGRVIARGARPIMLFTKQPRYSAMFPFFTSGQQYVDATLPGKINTEIGWAIKRHMKRVWL